MNDAAMVSMCDCVRDALEERDDLAHRSAFRPPVRGDPLNVLHQQQQLTGKDVAAKDMDDVRMAKRRRRPHFAFESRTERRRAGRDGRDALDRDDAPCSGLKGLVDDALSAAAGFGEHDVLAELSERRIVAVGRQPREPTVVVKPAAKREVKG